MEDFTPYGKTPRLYRNVVITEKIDGTNGGILIQKYDDLLGDDLESSHPDDLIDAGRAAFVEPAWGPTYVVRAQSRNRYVFPGQDNNGFVPGQDNYGFGAYVHENADTLVEDLGEGLHFGEWFGRGINRGYGLDERYFALFNPHKLLDVAPLTPNLTCVPLIDEGTFSDDLVDGALRVLDEEGSLVPFLATGDHTVPGPEAEGIIIYHSQSKQVYKVLLESDHLSKTEAGL